VATETGQTEARGVGANAHAAQSGSHKSASLMRRFGPDLACFVIPFALLVYLGLEGGGYGVGLEPPPPGETNGVTLRSWIAIAAWGLIVVGAITGVIRVSDFGRAAWTALGIFTAFAVWTGLSMLWSDSPERSFDEFTRVLAYLGVFALAISAVRWGGVRRAVAAVGAAVAVIGVIALLSRLHPSWFPVDLAAQELANVQARLNYPINYWNGLAALIGIGFVSLLALAAHGRHVVTQALATAALPALMLAGFYTVSRSAPLIVALGVSAYLVLHPRRIEALIPLGLGVAGGVLAIAAAAQRDALEENLGSTVAARQGDEMLAITFIVCLGVGLLRVAADLAARHGLGPRPTLSPRAVQITLGALVVCVLGAGLVAGAPGKAADAWDEFKQAGSPTGDVSRYASASGNGRYQYWGSALEQNGEAPLRGTGAGTFELWWQQHGEIPGAVRDAHSLYFETLGELGVIGFLLLAGVVVAILVAGVRRTRRAPLGERELLAAAVGGTIAFAFAMGIDWGWEIAILPIAFLVLGATLVTDRNQPEASPASAVRGRIPSRIPLALVSVLALAASTIALLGSRAMEASQAAARAGAYTEAADQARRAGELQPWATKPILQEALVAEEAGDLDTAASLAYEAIEEEPLNWEHRITAARIEQERGDDETAHALVDNARPLYPTFLGYEGQPLPEALGIDYEPPAQP
jgi:type II secretory pathway pseudopilin PulG